VAASISGSPVSTLTSDDFITPQSVGDQLQELKNYVEERQGFDPDYDLPTPVGWRLTVLMLTIPEMSDGGVIMATEDREARSVASPQGVVLALGSAAYQDPARFSEGGELKPWVKVGDRVVWKRYDVMTFQIANGQRLGFMNDTQPYGVIDSGWIKEEDE
jgi:co-chaperonin GroES (HSP10)